MVGELGLVGVREYPQGTDLAGDIDSGPLVAGVSASASALTLAAARRVGDQELAETLNREAEFLGFGLSWGGERRYALGQLPAGDAFLGYARSRPLSESVEVADTPSPWWPAYLVVALLPAAALGLRLRSRARKRDISAPTRSRLSSRAR